MTNQAPQFSLQLVPIGLAAANAWVDEMHRHHEPATGHKFSVACETPDGTLRGVAIAGRPSARYLDDGRHIEVLRVATDGTPNACSILYGAVARAAQGMGYPRRNIITYTLASEPGTSLVAAGWVRDIESGGGSWSRLRRPREDKAPLEPKIRWRAAA